MSRDLTRPVQRGLLVPDPRVTLDRTDPAHTWVEVGPRPGVPEDQGSPRSALVWKTSGSQTADAQLRLRINRAGFPGERRRAGGYVYRDEANTDWRGWDVPNLLTGWEWTHYQPSPSTLVMTQPHLLRLQSGRVLLAARLELFGGLVSVRRYDPATGAWSTLASVAPPGSGLALGGESLTVNAWPCLVQLPDGRVLLFAWVGDGSSYSQLSQWYSDDEGATWTRGARWCLETEEALGAISGKFRIAHNNGQLLAVATHSTGVLRQWASDDLGARFVRVGDTDTGVGGRSPELLPLDGGAFRVLFVDDALTVRNAHIGTAWEPLATATAPTMALLDGVADEVAAWGDEDGTWYAAAVRASTDTEQDRMRLARSIDQGGSWTVLGRPWPQGGNAQMPYQVAGAMTCGLGVIACRFGDEVSGLGGASMLTLYLGGHSTVTMPSSSRSRRDVHQTWWQILWLPVDTPDVWGWTAAGVATSESLTQDGHVVEVGTGNNRTWTRGGMVSLLGYEAIAAGEVRVAEASLSGYAALAAWAGDATAGYGAEVRLSGSTLTLRDASGTGGQIGSAVPITWEAPMQVLLAVGNGQARCWYRPVAAPGEPEREWTAGPAGSPTVATGLTTLGSVRHRVASPVGSTTAIWRWVAGTTLAPVVGLADGPSYPEELFARSLSARPVRLPGGVVLEATDGPALEGQTWHVDPRFEFGLQNADPLRYPSPRRVARCEPPPTKAEAVYVLSGVAGEATRLDSASWGVAVIGANTCDVQLHGWDPALNAGAGDWVALTSGSSWVEGLAFERVGDVVQPDPAEPNPASSPLYVERDMLAGAVIDLGGKLRRIARNTEGWWGSGRSRRPVLYLDTAYLDGTEPTSGTCRIGPAERGQVIIVHGLDRYERLRVVLGSGYGDQVEVGAILVGAVCLFGQEYSWGRVRETQPNVSLSTLRGGTRHSRVDGPPRRSVEFGWSDGVHDRQLWSGDAPDYIRGGPADEPVAVAADVGSVLEGLIRQLQGPHRPVVYLPAVPSDTGEVRLLWPSAHLYGRIVSSIRREPYLGNELEGEVERVASIRIEEEV